MPNALCVSRGGELVEQNAVHDRTQKKGHALA